MIDAELTKPMDQTFMQQQTPALLFRRAIAQHWPLYALGCFAMLVTSASEVMVPKFVQWGLDFLSSKGDFATLPQAFREATPQASLTRLTQYLLIVLVLAYVGRMGWRQSFGRRTHDAGYDLKNRFWVALRWQPLRFFHRYPLGDLMNRAIGDWNRVRFIHGFTFVLTFDVIFFAVLAVISMLLIDVQLTILCLVTLPFLPRPILRLARLEGQQHVIAQEKLSSLSDLISQAINTIRLQRATASDHVWQDNLRKEALLYAEKNYDVLKTGWRIFPWGALPTVVAYGVMLSFGVYKITKGELTIGEFVAMQSYVLLLQSPLFELAQVFSEWQTGFGSFWRMTEIFNAGEAAEGQTLARNMGAEPSGAKEGSVPMFVMEGVSFSYSDRTVLKDISMNIHRGERIGIAGPIGSGKSTLLRIMAGLADGQGECFILGVPVLKASRHWLAQNVVMVPQKAFLFSGSIAYNLCMNEDFTEEKLWDVLEAVQLANDVRHFPEGLNTWIGEWGINLSGGQKQRLALARALLRPSPLLLLDDCLSAVDAITEEKILAALDQRLSGQTIVWVAHRLSTLKLCDRIFKMERGSLEEVQSIAEMES